MNVPGVLLFLHLCAMVDVTVSAPVPCGSPPSLADGVIVAAIKELYAENDRVEYGCPLYYTMEGGRYKTCINGEWTGEIRCNKPCTVDREAMNRHNIEFKYSRDDKIYSEHNDTIVFQCKRGRRIIGPVAMRQTCVDGVIELPTCSEPCTVDREAMDRHNLDSDFRQVSNLIVFQCKRGRRIIGPVTMMQTCVDGVIELPTCSAMSCGHPGEAKFADFQLEEGKDFVFSSKVIYTCHKGYQMVSRRNFRICTDGGWDGAVPVCEPKYCPVILVDQNLRVEGIMEEATYGSVIQFKCHDHGKALYGASEIYCEENGEWKGVGWDGQPPTCDVIKCTPPEIENGYLEGNVDVYYQDQTLRYKCNRGFQPRTSSVCSLQGAKAGWSTKPVCEVVRCKFLHKPIGTSYDPDKTVFSPDEEVTIQCGEKYEIGNNKGTSAKAVCKDNGDWSIAPQCTEVRCRDPQDRLVHNHWDFSRSKKIDETVEYRCKTGYKPNGVTQATCKRNGWTPNPLCIDNRECSDPIVQNGFYKRQNKGPMYYTCDEGYKLFTKGWWASAECKARTWSTIQKCIENTKCGELPVIPHGKATTQNTNQGQEMQITCDEGYSGGHNQKFCVNGEWDLGTHSLTSFCTAIGPLCDPPPRVKNTLITTPYKEEYVTDSTVTYECRHDYTLQGDATITCNDGQWQTRPIRCIPPASYVDDVQPNPKVPVKEPCTVDREAMRRQNIEFKYSRDDKIYSEHNDMIEFRCKGRMRKSGPVAMRQKCVQGVIDLPTCSR